MGLFDIFRKKEEPAEGAADNESMNTSSEGETTAEDTAAGEAAADQEGADNKTASPGKEAAEAGALTADAGPGTDQPVLEGMAPEMLPADNSAAGGGAAPGAGQRKLTPEEIAARREAIRKQQEEQETKGKLLSYMIDQYHEQRTPKALEAAIRCLGDTMVVVPMQMLLDKSDAEAMALARQQGRQFKPSKPVRLVPALMKNAKGSLHYPVYASRADIPKDQVKQFIWVNVPAPKCSVDVIRNEKVESLVVNPFGKSLVLNRELLKQIIKVKPVETPTVEGEGGYTS